MLKQERHAFIMHQINLHNKVLSNNLAADIKVSEDTIRRDLQELAAESKLIKVHGGALSLAFNEVPFSSGKSYSFQNKNTIASKAVQLIQNGMFVLTSGGTTILEMARSLPPQLKATFITGSIPAAHEYMMHAGIEVIIIGDKIMKESKITAGPDAISKIRQINADLCFLGINAIHPVHGITENDWTIAQLKKEMIAASSKVVCLTIAEKLNTFQPLKICGLNQVDVLITELDPDHELLKPYKDAGIHIL